MKKAIVAMCLMALLSACAQQEERVVMVEPLVGGAVPPDHPAVSGCESGDDGIGGTGCALAFR